MIESSEVFRKRTFRRRLIVVQCFELKCVEYVNSCETRSSMRKSYLFFLFDNVLYIIHNFTSETRDRFCQVVLRVIVEIRQLIVK